MNGDIVEGKWIFANGTYFEGKFEKNKPKGMGHWHFANGNVVKGEFTHSTLEEGEEPITVINWTTNSELVDPTRFKEEN